MLLGHKRKYARMTEGLGRSQQRAMDLLQGHGLSSREPAHLWALLQRGRILSSLVEALWEIQRGVLWMICRTHLWIFNGSKERGKRMGGLRAGLGEEEEEEGEREKENQLLGREIRQICGLVGWLRVNLRVGQWGT
jgi:hypothetical protein